VAPPLERTRLRWTEPAWRTDAERWIRERSEELGRSLLGAIEQPHVRPWGTAMRVVTDGGTLWFKASIAPLAYEVRLLEIVGRRRPDCIPELLAGDGERGWALIADAGVPLTDVYPDGPPLRIWLEFLPAYAELQHDLVPDVDGLVAAGVPDRRAALVEGFQRVVESERAAGAATDGEVARLRSLVPRLREAVDVLAALGLPGTLHHDDLHPWNVCLAEHGYHFIDWGDACVAQPLLSLGVPLAHVVAGDAAAARDAYLEPWTALRPREELLAACDAAALLAHITGLLKWELINSGLAREERGAYGDVIPKRLRHLLEVTCA
jgi:Phosphotransferase enzyme family